MTMVELRCRFRIAAELDPENLRLVVLCRSCSHRRKTTVYHEWSIAEILERIAKGDTSGSFEPDTPRWVHWVVKSVA